MSVVKTFTRSIVASVFLVRMVVGAQARPRRQELPATREAALYSITHGFRETSLPLLRRPGWETSGCWGQGGTSRKALPCPLREPQPESHSDMVGLTYADWSCEVVGRWDGGAISKSRRRQADALHRAAMQHRRCHWRCECGPAVTRLRPNLKPSEDAWSRRTDRTDKT